MIKTKKKEKTCRRVAKKLTAEKKSAEQGFSNSRPNIKVHQSNGRSQSTQAAPKC